MEITRRTRELAPLGIVVGVVAVALVLFDESVSSSAAWAGTTIAVAAALGARQVRRSTSR